MATYYVDGVNGADANNGLGPDASAPTNKPWKTLGKALGASGIASGDTLYIAPGTYRAQITPNVSASVETLVLGDPFNQQGFKTSSGTKVTAGPVIWTAYLTDDRTNGGAAPGNPPLALASKNHYTFRNIAFIGGQSAAVGMNTAATDLKFNDCSFIAGNNNAPINLNGPANAAANWTFQRCIFRGSSAAGISASIPTSASGADWDSAVLIENCLFVSTGNQFGIVFLTSGTNAFKPGGGVVRGCTFLCGGLQIASTHWSTTLPANFYNNVVSGTNGVSSGSAGQLVEDYNIFDCPTPRITVTAGTHSSPRDNITPLLFHMGEEAMWGFKPRTFGEPWSGSGLLGFGDGGATPNIDGLNRPRPAGGASSAKGAGWLERGRSFGKETATVKSGTLAISAVGPAYHDLWVPVNAVPTTFRVYCRRDSTYAGTNPQLELTKGEEVGVADTTITDAGAANAWNVLTVTVTPTSSGVLLVRLLSNDTNGGGHCYFDDFAGG